MKEDSEIKWECPNCEMGNVDDIDETVFPLCEVCSVSFDWSEVKRI
jgi:uncharacterized protein (DUF983 family)